MLSPRESTEAWRRHGSSTSSPQPVHVDVGGLLCRAGEISALSVISPHSAGACSKRHSATVRRVSPSGSSRHVTGVNFPASERRNHHPNLQQQRISPPTSPERSYPPPAQPRQQPYSGATGPTDYPLDYSARGAPASVPNGTRTEYSPEVLSVHCQLEAGWKRTWCVVLGSATHSLWCHTTNSLPPPKSSNTLTRAI